MTDADPFDLNRFVAAQRHAYAAARAEIAAGRKRGHWMWFIFPQIVGLGHSAMAQAYAIGSLAEARAYLALPVLGGRYAECVAALDRLDGGTADDVFGTVDAMKLRSSLTLFERAGFERAGAPDAIGAAIDRWFGGRRDDATLRIVDTRR